METFSPTSRAERTLTADQIARYQEDGFVVVRNVLSPEEASAFRAAAMECDRRIKSMTAGSVAANVFDQLVNVWQQDPVMRRLTLSRRLGAMAEQLAGVPLRLWHDQLLIKQPNNRSATEWHQNKPYWPHANSNHPLSAWIALQDVPVERGCMSFIPGSHRFTNLPSLDLLDANDLFKRCPELLYFPRITAPLRAGDCTFHHGYCAHMAGPNQTNEARVAHVVIYIDAGTRYCPRADGQGHPVTDSLGLSRGDLIDGELFPKVSCFGDPA